MSERVFRIASLFFVIALIFTIKAQASETTVSLEEPSKKSVTEMQKAIHLAAEIQALNRGDFDSRNGPYHPNRQLLLDDSTLRLSVKRN